MLPSSSCTIAPAEFPSTAATHPNDDHQRHTPTPTPTTPQWASLSELLDADKSPDFTVFKLNQGCSKYLIVMFGLQTLLHSLKAVSVSTDGVPMALRLIAYVQLVIPLIAWVYYVFLSRRYVNSDTLTADGEKIMLLGNINLVVQAVCAAVFLLAWATTRDDCHSNLCLQDYPKHAVPLHAAIRVAVISIGMPIFFSCHNVYVSFISLFILLSAFLASVVILHVEPIEIGASVFMAISMICILFCYQGNLFSSYNSYKNLESVLRVNVASENNEYLMKLQTKEMRHMIGT
jgi:hypothetical protein